MIIEASKLLSPSRTLCGLVGGSKKRTLEQIAQCITRDIPTLDREDLFRRLMARERLGSTGIGEGIAIPHCRLDNCTGTIGALFTLAQPLPFDAVDDQPVDIIFTLLAPEEAQDSHLKTLSALAKMFSIPQNVDKLRSARDDSMLFDAVSEAMKGTTNIR